MSLTRPSRRLCAWGAAASALFVLRGLDPGLAPLPWLALGVLASLFAVDAWMLRRAGLEVRRAAPVRLSLDRPVRVTLEITSRAPHGLDVSATDDLCPALEGNCSPETRALLPGETLAVSYEAVPRVRGEHALGPVVLRTAGPLGLAWNQRSFPCEGRVRVYPDWGIVSAYEALLLRGRTLQIGVRSVRETGAGWEFAGMRDFQPGDDPRHLDWKASRRRARLTWRTREPERQQEVLILVDAGRLSTSLWKGRERLEVVLRAAGLLAWVVARSYDAVGIVTFSSRVREALKPVAGPRAIQGIREVLLRTRSDLGEPDYGEAFATARSLLGKRSLLILFSEPVGTSLSSEIRRQFTATERRHLNAMVAMRDPEVWRRASARAAVPADLVLRAAAEAHIQERQRALADLRASGVLIVDTFPEDLAPAAVNRYLSLKAERRL